MIRRLSNTQLFRYTVAGGGSYVIELLCLLGLYKLGGFSVEASTAIAFWVGLATSFLLQKLFAFKDYQKTLLTISHQLGAYIALVVFNYIFTLAVVSLFPDKYVIVSRTFALVLTTAWNYLIYKRIFSNTKEFNLLKFLRSGYLLLLTPWQHKTTQIVLASLSVVLLTGLTVYGAVNASYYLANDSDALVDTYLLDDGVANAHINLQPEHTNVLKFPIFALHSLFPYTYTSFVALNVILSLVTVLSWLYLVRTLFGNKHTSLIALVMSCLIVGSVELNMQYTWTTIRNIEFPLALLIILAFTNFVAQRRVARRSVIGLLGASLLFGVLVASDVYFLYVIALPLVLFVTWHVLANDTLQTRHVIVYGALASSAVIGLTLPLVLQGLGVISLHASGAFGRSIVGYDLFYRSLQVAFKQYMQLGGGFIFGEPTKVISAGIFVNFFIMIAAIVGGVKLLPFFKRPVNTEESDRTTDRLPALAVVSMTFFVVFAVYVFSGQVVQTTSDGKSISELQQRYIAFMVFLAIPLFVWLMNHFTATKRISKLVLFASLILALPVHFMHTKNQWNSIHTTASERRTLYLTTAHTLDREKVSVALTGHWYGASTRFWSKDTVDYAPVQGCNKPFQVLSRPNWYIPKQGAHSALIVDHGTYDSYFWMGCDDTTLLTIYGAPAKRVPVSTSTTLWLYDYDVRTRLDPRSPTY